MCCVFEGRERGRMQGQRERERNNDCSVRLQLTPSTGNDKTLTPGPLTGECRTKYHLDHSTLVLVWIHTHIYIHIYMCVCVCVSVYCIYAFMQICRPKYVEHDILYSCLTQGRVEGWEAMTPLCWRSVNGKGAGRPRLSHHHRGWWIEMDEMSVQKLWNEICGRGKLEKPREKPTQSSFRPPNGVTEAANSGPQCSGWRRAPNYFRHEAATYVCRLIKIS